MTPPRTPELTETQRVDLARARRAAFGIGLLIPLALLGAAAALLVAWMPRLPDPAATHWSGSGGPDGFGSPWTYVWILIGIGGGLVLLIWALAVLGGRLPGARGLDGEPAPAWSGIQRLLVAFGAGFSLLMITTAVGSAAVQLDLADAADAGSIGWLVALGFGCWIAGTALAWFAQPSIVVRLGPAAPAAPLPVRPTERVVWFGDVRPSRVYLGAMGIALLTLGWSTVFVFAKPVDPWARSVTVSALVLVVLLGTISLWFRVRIDRGGLEARSIVGWPVLRVPADDVRSVEAASINPLGDFGGWGLRWAPGRTGLVMREGEGLVVTRKDGRIFAVTLDDAETAASVLAAVALPGNGHGRPEGSEDPESGGRGEDR
ncbi:DUF1648 domain-containing protein [Leucobacter zeae]|nr:DUF1648 domain-containing protein [Leucobacter zeae]